MNAENQFRWKVERELKKRGVWSVKYVAGALTKSGIPDLLCCCQGRFLGIELKGGSSYGASALQKYQIEEINRAGGVGIVLYPGGFERFCRMLDDIRSVDMTGAGEDRYILR